MTTQFWHQNRGVLFSTLLLLGFLFIFTSLKAQETDRSILVKYITEKITLNGSLDEPGWQTADVGANFWQYFPTDTARTKYPTEFRLLYDDHFLYIGVRGTASSDKYVVSSLRRDFKGTTNDNVTLMFDTFKDGNTAFLFGMTPYGVQREAFISQGGAVAGFNPNWDQKWQLESKIYDDHFILEAAIPFSSIKFRDGETEWRVQCYRWDIGANEQSAWARVPQNQLLSSLAFMNKMVFEKPLGKSRTPIAIIPYVNALTSNGFDTGASENKLKYGGDAKIAIDNSMNLDITVNPDFSNVEVDDIFTNLTRFEVFLPEKRQFFIDNKVLAVGGYELGALMIEVEKQADGSYRAKELFRTEEFGDQTKPPLLHNGYFYAQFGTNRTRDGLTCMSMDGEIMWKTKRDPDFNKGSMILADGLIIATDGMKKLYLIEPDPTGFKLLASVEIFGEPEVKADGIAARVGGSMQNWAPIALADGKLLIRDQSRMMCLKVAE